PVPAARLARSGAQPRTRVRAAPSTAHRGGASGGPAPRRRPAHTRPGVLVWSTPDPARAVEGPAARARPPREAKPAGRQPLGTPYHTIYGCICRTRRFPPMLVFPVAIGGTGQAGRRSSRRDRYGTQVDAHAAAIARTHPRRGARDHPNERPRGSLRTRDRPPHRLFARHDLQHVPEPRRRRPPRRGPRS